MCRPGAWPPRRHWPAAVEAGAALTIRGTMPAARTRRREPAAGAERPSPVRQRQPPRRTPRVVAAAFRLCSNNQRSHAFSPDPALPLGMTAIAARAGAAPATRSDRRVRTDTCSRRACAWTQFAAHRDPRLAATAGSRGVVENGRLRAPTAADTRAARSRPPWRCGACGGAPCRGVAAPRRRPRREARAATGRALPDPGHLRPHRGRHRPRDGASATRAWIDEQFATRRRTTHRATWEAADAAIKAADPTANAGAGQNERARVLLEARRSPATTSCASAWPSRCRRSSSSRWSTARVGDNPRAVAAYLDMLARQGPSATTATCSRRCRCIR